MRNSFVKISIFGIVYIIIVSLLYWYFSVDKANRINVYLTQQIDKLKSEFKATKNTYEKLSNFIYDELIQDETFLTLVKKKKTQELYNYLLPHYQILKKYHINYLSINLPDGTKLVNMYKPNRLQPLKPRYRRKIFDKKDDNIDIVIEFERPIFHDKLLGIFRSAISYSVFKKELQNLFGGYYEYILKNELINKNIFHYGNYLFIQSDLHPKYYYEENSIHSQHPQQSIVHLINLKIKSLIKQRLSENRDFALLTNINGDFYSVTFLAIKYKNKHIGYLISYKKDNTIALFDTIFIQNLLFGSLLVLILLSFIYYFLHVRDKFEKMAVTDKLTGLLNRHKFYEIAEQEIHRSKRNNKPFSVIIFDIDHFKKINDQYGHDVGDYVLSTIAKLVQKNIRKSDFVFRWGGEEFVILLPETDSQGAFKLAEKIRNLISDYNFDHVGHVTVSLGISQYDPQRDQNIDSIIKRADNALYQSKESGRNRTNIAL